MSWYTENEFLDREYTYEIFSREEDKYNGIGASSIETMTVSEIKEEWPKVYDAFKYEFNWMNDFTLELIMDGMVKRLSSVKI